MNAQVDLPFPEMGEWAKIRSWAACVRDTLSDVAKSKRGEIIKNIRRLIIFQNELPYGI